LSGGGGKGDVFREKNKLTAAEKKQQRESQEAISSKNKERGMKDERDRPSFGGGVWGEGNSLGHKKPPNRPCQRPASFLKKRSRHRKERLRRKKTIRSCRDSDTKLKDKKTEGEKDINKRKTMTVSCGHLIYPSEEKLELQGGEAYNILPQSAHQSENTQETERKSTHIQEHAAV